MKIEIITEYQQNQRTYWVDKMSTITKTFGSDSQVIENEIANEVKQNGLNSLLGHLRLCGAIPEKYGHDTSEEKLYSKYTDIVINEAYKQIGFQSLVLKERADVADVECVTKKYSFVADAKAFRLSRTAKNQKDFKVQAMDNWKHGKPYAMVVSPIYQLPSRTSQIYQQSATRSVLISTYTHLALLAQYAQIRNQNKAIELVHVLFQIVEAMNPSKSAIDYWQTINKTILSFDKKLTPIWKEEKQATIEGISIVKKEALQFLAKERERIMKLSKEEAIKEVLKYSKIKTKIDKINSVGSTGLLNTIE
jgi:type II restriction enzyme